MPCGLTWWKKLEYQEETTDPVSSFSEGKPVCDIYCKHRNGNQVKRSVLIIYICFDNFFLFWRFLNIYMITETRGSMSPSSSLAQNEPTFCDDYGHTARLFTRSTWAFLTIKGSQLGPKWADQAGLISRPYL